ncbi:MAG: hypothetical protein LCH30_01110 [Proteobacteria bacterium]|nr:hypothetical protein [Pseudomonadota bacterium]
MRDWFGRNLVGNIVILYGQQFYFGDLTKTGISATPIIETEGNKDLLQSLTAAFDTLKPHTYKRANDNNLKTIISLLGGLDINLISGNKRQKELEEKLQQAKETHKKLAIIKINDLVGYGVIALEDIPANTIVTFYAGLLSRKAPKKEDDAYVLGAGNSIISAKTHRNFAGFITHAFEKKSSSSTNEQDKVYLDDFSPKEEDNIRWQANLVSCNLFPKKIIFNNRLYAFLESREVIKKGSILAWDYGLGYWAGRKIAPALLTRQGEIISPSTYLCSHYSYIRAFTRKDDEILKNPGQLSLFRTEPNASLIPRGILSSSFFSSESEKPSNSTLLTIR